MCRERRERGGEARRDEARRPGPEALSGGSTLSTLTRQANTGREWASEEYGCLGGRVSTSKHPYSSLATLLEKASIMLQLISRDLRAQGCKLCLSIHFR